MKRTTVYTALAVAALAGAVAIAAEARIAPNTATFWPAAQIKWQPMAGLPGASEAHLWGDPTKEAHGVLYRWPAGTAAPLHHHSHGDRGVIVSGSLVITPDGGREQVLGPGSYFTMAAGVKHTTTCKTGAECVFFVAREGAFDVVMAGAK
jgi:quercetin dioxygenase-like cupin family protein